MSSFVIGKKFYIQCAGAICGLSAALYREPLWIYNYTAGRNFNDDDYYTLFSWFYTVNAKSVQKQYGDAVPESDDNNYKADFEKYKKIARQYVLKDDTKTLVKYISDFFRSVTYQIEDEKYNYQVSYYLNKILVEIMHKTLLGGECLSWGDFELPSIA